MLSTFRLAQTGRAVRLRTTHYTLLSYGRQQANLPQCVASFHVSHSWRRGDRDRSRDPQTGLTTPVPDESAKTKSKSVFYFEAGYAGWPKRPARPFPPPFFSPPSGSFSDPLSTHNRSRSQVNGEMILGVTNGDDAMLVGDNFLAANDGVGAWAQKDRGNAGLWSRLVIHFWIKAAEEDGYGAGGKPDPVRYLSSAFARTKEALSEPNEWLGTTTACSALLHHSDTQPAKPMLYVTQLGDCKIMVVRSSLSDEENVIFRTEEQYHYFDCPRQLGTNSPDTPEDNAVLDVLELEEDDIVLALSDGVTDNLWEHEIARFALEALNRWNGKNGETDTREEGAVKPQRSRHGRDPDTEPTYAESMKYVAQEIVLEARKIAEDNFAESPYMEKGVEEGLAIEGGKLDDISVVAGLVRQRTGG